MRVNKKILNKETKESFSPLDEKKEHVLLLVQNSALPFPDLQLLLGGKLRFTIFNSKSPLIYYLFNTTIYNAITIYNIILFILMYCLLFRSAGKLRASQYLCLSKISFIFEKIPFKCGVQR